MLIASRESERETGDRERERERERESRGEREQLSEEDLKVWLSAPITR